MFTDDQVNELRKRFEFRPDYDLARELDHVADRFTFHSRLHFPTFGERRKVIAKLNKQIPLLLVTLAELEKSGGSHLVKAELTEELNALQAKIAHLPDAGLPTRRFVADPSAGYAPRRCHPGNGSQCGENVGSGIDPQPLTIRSNFGGSVFVSTGGSIPVSVKDPGHAVFEFCEGNIGEPVPRQALSIPWRPLSCYAAFLRSLSNRLRAKLQLGWQS
jgi:hypothetical protein